MFEKAMKTNGLRVLCAAGIPLLLGACATMNAELKDGENAEARKEIWPELAPFFEPLPEFAGDYSGYRSPLVFEDGRKVETPADWQERRKEIKELWHDWMGEWPELISDPEVEVLSMEKREDFVQKKVRFAWTPNEKTEGYLLVPEGDGPYPAVVVVYYEPETGAGIGGKPYRDYAYQLTKRGFVTLSIGTTEATAARTYALYYPSIEDAQVQPLSMLGYAAANAWYVLAAQPEVDDERIGIVGHSFGGKWAMFGSTLFDKFAAAVWSDPGIVFDTRPSVNYWEPWYLGYHPKPWRKRGVITEENPAFGLYLELRENERDLHELHALMAPRPFLVSGGSEEPAHRWRALNHTIAVNDLLGYSGRVGMTMRPEHSPNEESNEQVYSFFEYFLKYDGVELRNPPGVKK